jgi:hypothetical protein
MVISKRVSGFKPSINGFHFKNTDWPNVPDYSLNIMGQAVTIGNASNGLCGGMAFAVKDLFQGGFQTPPNTIPPAGATDLFKYIVARLTNSFDYDDVNQYLSWIQMSNHDTGFDTPFGHIITARGLAWHMVMEEWATKIKFDIDNNFLSTIGLVHGQEPATVGVLTGIQDLKYCHQMIVWGYDLDGTKLTLYVYDPNSLRDDNIISLDIKDPTHGTPITVLNYDPDYFRGFFRTHYSYNDPSKGASGAFIGTVVSSGPIVSAPTQPPQQPITVTRTWVSASGNPLVRFTGSVHNWSSSVNVNPADASKIIQNLSLTILTGGDDLRAGSGVNDNCDIIVGLKSGLTRTIKNINGGQNWKNNQSHTIALPGFAGVKASDISNITLHTQFGGGMSGDNWNVNQVTLTATLQ